MPRLSKLTILKNEALNKLNSIKNKLDGRTFSSYNKKIINAVGEVATKKLISQINSVKNTSVEKVLTAPLIKKQNKPKVNLLKELKKVNKEELLKKKPRFVSMKLLDKVKYFTKYGFTYNNIDTEEEFYNAIKKSILKLPNTTSVSIFIRTIGGNKVRAISLTRNELDTYEDFKYALNNIVLGNFQGSDAINLDEYEIMYNDFALSEASVKANGSSIDMIFEVYGIEESKRMIGTKEIGNKDCVYMSLLKIKELGMEINLEGEDINKFRDVFYLRNFLQQNNLKINIITNSFTMKRNLTEIMEDGEKKRIYIKDKKGNNRLNICSKIDIEKDIDIVYLHKNFNAKHTIIYDEINQHCDVIKGDIKMNDDVYLSYNSDVIKNDRILFKPKQINKNSFAEKKVELRYVFFDYETVIDFDKSSCMKEYSLSILNLNADELRELTNADNENNIDKVNEIRKRSCITFLGYDCSTKFIEWVLQEQIDKAFVFIGFNNANFDNFILLDALLRYDGIHEFSVGDIFYNGSQLLNFHMNGRHDTFDIHKHLMGSLKNNCDSFKINCCAKKSFDHNKAQQLYLDGELINFITDNEELKEYNEFDVLATAVLFQKYKDALEAIEATKEYSRELHSIKTIGSLIYKVFEKSKRDKKFDLPKLNYKQYTDLQKSKIAGRVELFNGIQKVEERLVSTDVCSLYPYVMSVAPVYYPCGKMIETDKYMGGDVIGFYYCDIDQSNLRGNNLPKIYAKKSEIENNWGHEEVLENYLISNVMIELLLKYGCGVVIKNGFYFTEKKKSCEMFDFLLNFMSAKNEQDTLKKNKSNDYNSALRETLKLLMNSLSGKVIEGLHTEKTENVDSVLQYEKIKDKCEHINFINAIGNKIFITYEIDGEKIINKQRPIYLGVLIYDYAKSYMYENSYSKVGLDELLYTDTDASKFRYKKFIEWKQWVDDKNIQVPHWKEVELIDERYKNHKIYETGSKVFGSFEDELEESIGEKYTFYCLEKKSWCYSVDGHSKFRFKGLNGSALLLTLGEAFITTKTIKHKTGTIENKFIIKQNSELDVYNFAQDNKQLAIENSNEEKFFEQVYSKGEAYLLCSSFRKIVKNSAHNVQMGNEKKYNNLMNKIQVNYMMKHISIKKI